MLALQQGNCPQEEGRDSSLGRLLGKVLVVQAGGLEFHPLSLRLQTKQSKTSKPQADMVACTCKPRAGEGGSIQTPRADNQSSPLASLHVKGQVFPMVARAQALWGVGTGSCLQASRWVVRDVQWEDGESLSLREVVKPGSA